ncbi:MAG: formylglycine-generating enzyme family protein [Verrucomicrobiales bacterium]|nr:formylglycine-generating enzyme family protein [Verrucomicrobiales bacterium]
MAGNVSEWTATWDAHPDSPDKRVPLKRGASFATKSGFDLKSRRAADSAGERNFWTGFRIASDTANPKKRGGGNSAPQSSNGADSGGNKMPDDGVETVDESPVKKVEEDLPATDAKPAAPAETPAEAPPE